MTDLAEIDAMLELMWLSAPLSDWLAADGHIYQYVTKPWIRAAQAQIAVAKIQKYVPAEVIRRWDQGLSAWMKR